MTPALFLWFALVWWLGLICGVLVMALMAAASEPEDAGEHLARVLHERGRE